MTPTPGHTADLIDYLRSVASLVHEEEPGCLRYCVNLGVSSSGDQIVMIERYIDGNAFDIHRMNMAERRIHLAALLAEPIDALVLQEVPCGSPEKGTLD